ncbi:MAG: hypothetical protein M3Z18_05055 [Gemmatimonadota bacterium]|nr:hypothetical protein [Gemmatimonadota bacterium]
MRTSSIVFTALLVASPIAGARAQATVADVRPAPSAVSGGVAAEAWSARPVGNYDVVLDSPEGAIAVRVTVSETQGKLVALFWPAKEAEGQAMDVAIAGTDMVLTAKTHRGPIEINIERRGQALSGNWTLGRTHGSLRGEISS